MRTRLDVLLWGDSTTGEMRSIVEHLADHRLAVQSCRDLSALPAWSHSAEPALVVALQNWPDEFPRKSVERAMHRFPLARWICCYGAWCLSDGRTRDVWPSGARIAVETAPARIDRELAVLQGELPPLPLTASRDEVFAFDHTDFRSKPTSSTSLALIITPDIELGGVLRGLLASEGWEAAHARNSVSARPSDSISDSPSTARIDETRDTCPALPCKLIVWDIDPWSAARSEELLQLSRRHPQARLIALANRPDPTLMDGLRGSGVVALLPKLAPTADLLAACASA